VALENDAALEDYTWRVAGCVGAFWTKLGFLTLGERFSNAPESELLEQGIAYGKGLQLVNILRDLPSDLAAGRCYLPVSDPADRDALLASHARWLATAIEWIKDGKIYAETLKMKRLRAATVLPAWLAEETLHAMRGASWDDLRRRVKVPRSRVYALLVKALLR
jgi:farnesyl-diphosphate farnesyltransferase